MRNYIRVEHKLHSTSKLFISQIMIPEVIFSLPIYIPRALNMATCIQQGDLFYSAGLHRKKRKKRRKKKGRGFGKNEGEWTSRVEISKEEIPSSKCSMYG